MNRRAGILAVLFGLWCGLVVLPATGVAQSSYQGVLIDHLWAEVSRTSYLIDLRDNGTSVAVLERLNHLEADFIDILSEHRELRERFIRLKNKVLQLVDGGNELCSRTTLVFGLQGENRLEILLDELVLLETVVDHYWEQGDDLVEFNRAIFVRLINLSLVVANLGTGIGWRNGAADAGKVFMNSLSGLQKRARGGNNYNASGEAASICEIDRALGRLDMFIWLLGKSNSEDGTLKPEVMRMLTAIEERANNGRVLADYEVAYFQRLQNRVNAVRNNLTNGTVELVQYQPELLDGLLVGDDLREAEMLLGVIEQFLVYEGTHGGFPTDFIDGQLEEVLDAYITRFERAKIKGVAHLRKYYLKLLAEFRRIHDTIDRIFGVVNPDREDGAIVETPYQPAEAAVEADEVVVQAQHPSPNDEAMEEADINSVEAVIAGGDIINHLAAEQEQSDAEQQTPRESLMNKTMMSSCVVT